MSTPQPSDTPASALSPNLAPRFGFAGQQQLLGVAALVLSLCLLGVCIYFSVMAYQLNEKAKKAEPVQIELTAPQPEKQEKPPLFQYSESLWTALASLIGSLSFMVIGGYALAKATTDSASKQERQARILFAWAGSVLGIVLAGYGLLLTLNWIAMLNDWLGEQKMPRQWPVMAALLTFVLGLGLIFISIHAIRIYERDSVAIRRTVYGVNLAISALLLLVGLLAVNVFVSQKVPYQLDTTESGLYSIEPSTQTFLRDLNQEITVYSTIPDVVNNFNVSQVRKLLLRCQEAAPRNFKVKYLSLTLDENELRGLREKYPQHNLQELGLLFVAANGRTEFVGLRDLFEQKSEPGTRQRGPLVFNGEAAVVKSLLFLTEDADRTIYFTQGHGELTIGQQQSDAGTAGRTAETVKNALMKAQFEVKPLLFDVATAKVPDDAVAVVIADPQVTLSANAVGAIETYMKKPRPNGKKGKLILLTSPFPNANGGVADTGLEHLLGEHGLALGKEYLYFAPVPSQGLTLIHARVGVTQQAFEEQNPIALAIVGMDTLGRMSIILPWCREISRLPGPPRAVQLTPLLATGNRLHWVETDSSTAPEATWQAFQNNVSLQAAKKLSNQPVTVAVTVSEEDKGRMAVYGSGAAFADSAARSSGSAEILTTTVNWLCERPQVANILGKTTNEYRVTRNPDGFQLFWFPTLAILAVVVTLGLGTWLIRRK